MSQVTNYTTPGTPLTMAALKIFLDDAYAAAASANRGSTAPSNPFEGMHWWDSSANPEILKRYTVTAGWVSLLSVNITTGAVVILMVESSVADEGSIVLDTGKTGRGWAMAGDNEEFIQFRFTAAGVVAIISNTANAINTDTDGNLCVYDAGTGIAIKNRLGATKNIRYIINYS